MVPTAKWLAAQPVTRLMNCVWAVLAKRLLVPQSGMAV